MRTSTENGGQRIGASGSSPGTSTTGTNSGRLQSISSSISSSSQKSPSLRSKALKEIS